MLAPGQNGVLAGSLDTYRPALAALGHHAPFALSPALCGQVRDRLSHSNETLEGSKILRIGR